MSVDLQPPPPPSFVSKLDQTYRSTDKGRQLADGKEILGIKWPFQVLYQPFNSLVPNFIEHFLIHSHFHSETALSPKLSKIKYN